MGVVPSQRVLLRLIGVKEGRMQGWRLGLGGSCQG